ncbi:L,D-transpeptidase family protein [Streptomyces sp. SL13]|uniref:L,D-transpeptidase family protein n=1 Tax=Streptantibioticus silvisoli TaxID=2705255 RepID=A0AA90GXL1_9ACTN|nr:L,D-transpeptidase family protein [Streptantibioticus silvisoli]MDI5962914.1 L,D-transpeptidase family protein [Streptantibioticus silvisoli]MDI5969744.1 L,D-transpeptidase family protein [Streptantibioticus silvisoli]
MRARTCLFAAVLTAASVGAVSGCGAVTASSAAQRTAAVSHDAPAATPSARAAALSLPARLPGVGPRTLAEVPADASQVVEVTGDGRNSPTAAVVLYQRTAAGWKAGATWQAHNALHGWSAHHTQDDLRSPIGVFGLTDAGGRLPDPGTKLPYDQSASAFAESGTGFNGESLATAFDYVVAINYNRKPGTSPLDWTRPMGASRGGGIWFHVDHGGPTHGCVSISRAHMKDLLRTLDPADHPVVVMGDAASLAR